MSAANTTEALHTPDELLCMPDGKGYELVRGTLIKTDMGAESVWVGGMLFWYLVQFVKEHDSGWVFHSEAGYRCFPHEPKMIRKPDISFIKTGRFPGDVVPKGWITIVPDLAVEVVSPRDRASELDEKLADYRAAGIPLTWVVYPESRSVMVHRRDGSMARLLEAESLSGEDILPGFSCPLREFLPAEPTETPQPPTNPS